MSNERRTRRLCFFALAVLLPAALWTEAHEDVMRAWQAHAFDAIEVDPTQSVTFGGLNWRLLELETPQNVKLPATAEVSVRVQLAFTSLEAMQSLRNCQPYLEDSSGQRWSPRPSRSREVSCSQLSLRADIDGKQAEFTERFLVPAARAAEVNLAIVIPKEQPRYLRFQRPAQ